MVLGLMLVLSLLGKVLNVETSFTLEHLVVIWLFLSSSCVSKHAIYLALNLEDWRESIYEFMNMLLAD